MSSHRADGTLLLGYIWKKAKVYQPQQLLPYQPPGVTKKMLEINVSKTIFKKEKFFQILKELIQLPLNSPRKSFTINKGTLIDIKQAKSPLTAKILECLFDTWVSHKEFSTQEISKLLNTLYTAAEKYVETNSVSNYEILEEFQNYLDLDEGAYIQFFSNSTSNASILRKLNTFTSSLCSILEELDNIKSFRIQLKQNLTTLISHHEEPQLVLDEKLKETRNIVEKLNAAIDQIVKQAVLTIPTLNHSENIISSIEDVNNSHLQITNEDSSPDLITELLLEKVMDLDKFPEIKELIEKTLGDPGTISPTSQSTQRLSTLQEELASQGQTVKISQGHQITQPWPQISCPPLVNHQRTEPPPTLIAPPPQNMTHQTVTQPFHPQLLYTEAYRTQPPRPEAAFYIPHHSQYQIHQNITHPQYQDHQNIPHSQYHGHQTIPHSQYLAQSTIRSPASGSQGHSDQEKKTSWVKEDKQDPERSIQVLKVDIDRIRHKFKRFNDDMSDVTVDHMDNFKTSINATLKLVRDHIVSSSFNNWIEWLYQQKSFLEETIDNIIDKKPKSEI